MNNNFQAPEYMHKQEKFNTRNKRMTDAISNKMKKQEKPLTKEMIIVPEEAMDVEEPE